MVENCKDRLFCSPDCCATTKEASRARLFPDVSRGSRAIRGDPQSVPRPGVRIVPPGVPDRPIRGESAEMGRSGRERCATIQLRAFSFRLSERISNQIARCRGMKAPAMIQLSKADTAFEQSVLRCTLSPSLLTVISYFGVLRIVHEHCCSCPERTYCSLPNFGRYRQEQLCRTDARQPSIRPDTTSQPIRSCADCRLFLSGSARIGKTAIIGTSAILCIPSSWRSAASSSACSIEILFVGIALHSGRGPPREPTCRFGQRSAALPVDRGAPPLDVFWAVERDAAHRQRHAPPPLFGRVLGSAQQRLLGAAARAPLLWGHQPGAWWGAGCDLAGSAARPTLLCLPHTLYSPQHTSLFRSSRLLCWYRTAALLFFFCPLGTASCPTHRCPPIPSPPSALCWPPADPPPVRWRATPVARPPPPTPYRSSCPPPFCPPPGPTHQDLPPSLSAVVGLLVVAASGDGDTGDGGAYRRR